MVFDRAAVIAPQRPRRVSTIKTSTSERDSLPKERRAAWEEGDLRRARQEKTFIHFALITFIYMGKLIPMSPLRSFGGIAPQLPHASPLSNLSSALTFIFFSFVY